MAYELYLRHYDREGTLKNAVLSPLWARFTDVVNDAGPLVFALDANHPQVSTLEEFDILEVMLRNRSVGLTDFERAYVAILRDVVRGVDEEGVEVLEFYAPGENHILSWRHILYYAGVANRSEFNAVEAETIMKTAVRYNCTEDAVHIPLDTTSRQRDGDLEPGMGVEVTIETDGGDGNVLSLAFAGGNLLSSLQRVAERGGGDFSMTWQGEGTAEWEFAFHLGQRGSDKSTGADRVLFALNNQTLLIPRLTSIGAHATVAIAGGRSSGEDRQVSEIEGPDFAADYDIEMFVDARQETTAAGREFRAEVALESARSSSAITFDVLQTANQFYSPVPVTGRKTYKAGDLVAVEFGGAHVLKIQSVRAEWRSPDRGDAFMVSIETREVPSA